MSPVRNVLNCDVNVLRVLSALPGTKCTQNILLYCGGTDRLKHFLSMHLETLMYTIYLVYVTSHCTNGQCILMGNTLLWERRTLQFDTNCYCCIPIPIPLQGTEQTPQMHRTLQAYRATLNPTHGLDVPSSTARCLHVHTTGEILAAKGGTVGKNVSPQFCLNVESHGPFRDLLRAAYLQHGTDDFTSPPKEGALRIFSPWKILTASARFEPVNLGT